MKNCLIYGNCQIEPLRAILESDRHFAEQYQFLDLNPVHLLNSDDVPDLEAKITQADLFIYQLVSDGYQGVEQFGTDYLCSRLPKTAKAISIPGAYFTGYHPAMINFKDGEGNKITEPCDYHDVNLLYLFDRGTSVRETLSIIQQADFYQPQYVLNNLDSTLKELRRREEQVDIGISEFIASNYRQYKLFHTMNHPGIVIISYLVDRILQHLKLPSTGNLQQWLQRDEVLDYTDFPLYPSVTKGLGIKFSDRQQYNIRGEVLSLKQALELFFAFYEQNPELVKLNIIQHQEKYAVTVCGLQVDRNQIFYPQVLDESVENSDRADELLDFVRQQTFQDLLDLAAQHHDSDRAEEAISLCQAALKIEPESIQGWRQLAHLYEARGNLQEAIAASDRARAINPQEADSLVHLARLKQLQGDTTAALDLYQQVIQLDPEQPPWVYRYLGDVLMTQDRAEKAIAAYQQAIELNPNFGAQIYLSLADAYEQQDRWQESVEAKAKAVEINPDLAEQIE